MKRARKVGESMRHIDDETKRLVAADRLAQLERDQAAASMESVGVGDDLWEVSDESDSGGKVKQRRKSTSTAAKAKLSAAVKGETLVTQGQRRKRRTIEMVLMDEPAALADRDTFLSIEAPPASKFSNIRPPLRLCSVCSYISTYKCLRCGTNFCSLPCNAIHRDTKCLKFAD
jgi:zinc finger HIT domain-containing protein 1